MTSISVAKDDVSLACIGPGAPVYYEIDEIFSPVSASSD